jgi:hypothetical protein
MVYRDLPIEEAQKRFDELSIVQPVAALPPITTVEIPKKPKRKTVKGLVPKNK